MNRDDIIAMMITARNRALYRGENLVQNAKRAIRRELVGIS